MEALGAAATIVQLISFTGEVLLKGYSFLSRVQRAPSEIRALMREVANLNALLDQLQSLSTESFAEIGGIKKENVQNALQTLGNLGVFEDCSTLMQVVDKSVKSCEQVEGHGVPNFAKKVAWPFKEKETKDIMAQLGRLREALSAAVVVDSARSLKELGRVVRKIDVDVIQTLAIITELQLTTQQTAEDVIYLKDILENKIEEDERVAIRKWLHPDGTNAEASLATALEMKQSETGRWLLDSEDFTAWTKNVHGCMWLYGIAGCGKTILSATIVNNLRQASIAGRTCVVYFFSDHRNPNMQSLQDLLHVIVKELLALNPTCFEDAKYWYEERLRTVAGDTTAAKSLSTSEYIKFINQLCLRWESVSLVVDALDECVGLDSFVGGLKEFLGGSNVRLLLTSRHDVELKRVLGPIADYQISVMENMSEDIETYLVTEIQHRVASGTLKFKQKGLDTLIISAIVEKANGMILIAKLQLDYVCGLRSDRAIKEALAKLPSGVYETYDEILQQLCSKNPDDMEDMKRILQWLTCSLEPLTLEQLAEVVSIRPEDPRLDASGIATDPMDLAAYCGSLVTVHIQKGLDGRYGGDLRGPEITLITLAHASVEEYLKSGKIGQGLSSLFHVDEKIVHRQLAKTCLQYVGFEDFETPIEQPKGLFQTKDAPGDSLQILRSHLRSRTAEYALLDYACRHWASHLRQSESSESYDDETVRLLNWFIHSDDYYGNYVSWQQMYHHDVIWYCHNRPALFYAIDFKIDRLVKLLLPSDADVDTMPPHKTYGNWPQTALHVAARCGALSIVKDLVRRGASVELKSGPAARSLTALHFAAEGGHAEVIKFLLESGASPHSRSDSQSTPFYRAARSGSLKALQVLYDAGSDINALTWDKFTPLFEAVAHGRSRTANQLLDWGADPTVVNGMGESVLKILKKSRNLDAQKTGKPLVTEDDVLNDIQRIRASGVGFAYYLKDVKPQYVLAMNIEMDTRPGPEREKDYRWSRDPSKIVTMSEFRDRDD